MEGSQYLQRLLRTYAAQPEISAMAVDGPHPGRFATLTIYLGAQGDPPVLLPDLGETAFAGSTPTGAEIITPDGLTIRIALNQPVPAGAQVLRGGNPKTAVAPVPDVAEASVRFWRDLYQAAAAIGQEQRVTAHGRLEDCRLGLVNLYRLALLPTAPGAGWEGAEALPGAAQALEPLTAWLVVPLDSRAQWRCAHLLAQAFEKLMLPLTERLGLPYPWAMRNLAFRRLDEVRPDRAPAPEQKVPTLREAAAEADAKPPGGPARFKLRRRPEPGKE